MTDPRRRSRARATGAPAVLSRTLPSRPSESARRSGPRPSRRRSPGRSEATRLHGSHSLDLLLAHCGTMVSALTLLLLSRAWRSVRSSRPARRPPRSARPGGRASVYWRPPRVHPAGRARRCSGRRPPGRRGRADTAPLPGRRPRACPVSAGAGRGDRLARAGLGAVALAPAGRRPVPGDRRRPDLAAVHARPSGTTLRPRAGDGRARGDSRRRPGVGRAPRRSTPTTCR